MAPSVEQLYPQEPLSRNFLPMDPFFGPFFQIMRQALSAGSSELGLGMSLFSLAVSINATNIIEIGRFKGFSTFCLSSALRFLDVGWQESQHCKQRPDMNYPVFEQPRRRCLISIDPHPTAEAAQLIADAELTRYVVFVDQTSDACSLNGMADLLFVDGDHSYEACKRDVAKYATNHLRPGGYFIVHDYFGWYGADKINKSPIKAVAQEVIASGQFQHVLIDTGYMSFMIFRKPNPAVDG